MSEYKEPQSYQDFFRNVPETIDAMFKARKEGKPFTFGDGGIKKEVPVEEDPQTEVVSTQIADIKLEHEATTGINSIQVYFVDILADGRKRRGYMRQSNWAEIHPERLLGAGVTENHLKALAGAKNLFEGEPE